MQRRGLALLAILAATVLMAPSPPVVAPRAAWVPSASHAPSCTTLDRKGPYIEQPAEGCCTTRDCTSGGSTYQRWTPSRIARECNGCPVTISGDDTLTISVAGTLPFTTSTCLGLGVAGGEKKGATYRAYIDHVNALADSYGKARPLWFRQFRPDEAQLFTVTASEPRLSPTTFNPDWALRTPRSWSTGGTSFTGWLEAGRAADATRQGLGCVGAGNPWACCTGAGTGTCTTWSDCRSPSSSYDPNDRWGSGDSGLAGDCDDAANGWSLYQALEGKEAGLGRTFASYFFSRGGSTQQIYYPMGALADLSSSAYRAWYYAFMQLAISDEGGGAIVGPHLVLKAHQYRNTDGSEAINWPDTGDAYSGATAANSVCTASQITGTVNTLAELQYCDGMFTGPLQTKAGTDYEYPQYLPGLQALYHLAYTDTPRVPYLAMVQSYPFAGCTSLNADYTGTGCTDAYDWAGTPGVNEAALLRQLLLESGYIVFDLDGRRLDQNLGGLSTNMAGFIAMIRSSPVAQPIKWWIYDSLAPVAQAPAICGELETNPEPALSIAAPVDDAFGLYPSLHHSDIPFEASGAWGAGVPFVEPEAPTTNSSVSVNNAAAFTTAASSNGVQITVTASFSGDVTIAADDVDVFLGSGVAINGTVYIGGGGVYNRIRFRSVSPINRGRIQKMHNLSIGSTDIILQDVDLNGSSTGGGQDGQLLEGFWSSSRIALVNVRGHAMGYGALLGAEAYPLSHLLVVGSDLRAGTKRRGCTQGSSFFPCWCDSTSDGVAQCNAAGDELNYPEGWGIRFYGGPAIFYGNRLDTTRYHVIRQHPSTSSQELTWISGNTIQQTNEARIVWVKETTVPDPGYRTEGVWIDGNTIYSYTGLTTPCGGGNLDTPDAKFSHVGSNVFYTGAGGGNSPFSQAGLNALAAGYADSCPSPVAGNCHDWSGNAFNAYAAPPAWTSDPLSTVSLPSGFTDDARPHPWGISPEDPTGAITCPNPP